MNSLFDVVARYFEIKGWSFEMASDTDAGEEPTLRLLNKGVSGDWYCYARCMEENQVFAFYSVLPVNASDARLIPSIELVTLANLEMDLATVSVDPEDGEIMCRTSIDVQDAELTTDLVDRVVTNNLAAMENLYPAFYAVLEKNADPADALDSVR